MSDRKRIVITGLGIVSACGEGAEPFWDAVKYGRSAIAPLTSFEHNDLFAAECKNFNAKPYVKKRKSLKIMSRDIQMAVVASRMAIDDSEIVLDDVDLDHFGLSFGTGIINYELEEMSRGIQQGIDSSGNFSMPLFGAEGARALFPLWSLKYVPNMPACHVSIEHGLRGPSNTITTSGAAALQAIGEARNIIERGDATCMLAGGSDSQVNPSGLSRMQSLGFLPASEQGQRTYCPYNEGQDGFVLGEGAGILLLEEYEHARQRGATIYAEVKGYSSGIDGKIEMKQTLKSDAKVCCMNRALQDAGTSTSAIDFVIANGSGIAIQDDQEADAIQKVFGGDLEKTRVTGIKPIIGHTHHARCFGTWCWIVGLKTSKYSTASKL